MNARHSTKLIVLILALHSALSEAFTLEQALKNAKPLGYAAIEQQQRIAQSALDYQNIQQQQNYALSIDTQLGVRESFDKKLNDNSAFLSIKKNLFNSRHQTDLDFGKSNITLAKLRLDYLKLEQKIQIMRAFFAGVLADLEYDYLIQVLALSAVQQEHIKEDLSIGFASEVALAKAQAKTQIDSGKRQKAAAQQIHTRAQLNDLLTLPIDLDLLDYPVLDKYLSYQITDEKIWLISLEKHNSSLNILRLEIANLKRKKQQRSQFLDFTVDGFMRLGEQTYNKDKEGNYRAGLTLNIPLGDEQSAQEIKALDILIQQKQNALNQQNERLRQTVLDLSLKARAALQQYQALKTQQDYLSFNLDKASLEYEMRLSRNIGNAMILVTKNDLDLASAAFKLALLIEQMNLLAQGEIL